MHDSYDPYSSSFCDPSEYWNFILTYSITTINATVNKNNSNNNNNTQVNKEYKK
jgi:hypothetical protein